MKKLKKYQSHRLGKKQKPQSSSKLLKLGYLVLFLVLGMVIFKIHPLFNKSSHAQVTSIPLGVFVNTNWAQGDFSGSQIDSYAQETGKMPAIGWNVQSWATASGVLNNFDPRLFDMFQTRGMMPAITWSPAINYMDGTSPSVNEPNFNWQAIESGQYDQFITQWATAAKNYGNPFYLRMMHEMNGTWYPWAFNVNGNSNSNDYIGAWQHIVNIFRTVGATNVQFVWCISANPGPNGTSNIQAFYPGDSYVDWVAVDGYNKNVNNWTSLYTVYSNAYNAMTAFTQKPIMIFEVGSLENPNDNTAKASWITQGFLTDIPNSFPNIKAAMWFNVSSYAVDTSSNSLEAWKQVVSNSYYQGVMPGPGQYGATNPSPTPSASNPTPTQTPIPTPTPSPIPMTFLNVSASNITSSQATITWTTNPAGTSQVRYWLAGTTNYVWTGINKTLVTSHSVKLTSLKGATTYNYLVISQNSAGVKYTSSIYSFTTTH